MLVVVDLGRAEFDRQPLWGPAHNRSNDPLAGCWVKVPTGGDSPRTLVLARSGSVQGRSGGTPGPTVKVRMGARVRGGIAARARADEPGAA